MPHTCSASALGDEWALRKFRRGAAAGDPELARHQEMLVRRLGEDEKLDLAVRSANGDPDRKVRAAAVDVLLANQPRAQKQDAVVRIPDDLPRQSAGYGLRLWKPWNDC